MLKQLYSTHVYGSYIPNDDSYDEDEYNKVFNSDKYDPAAPQSKKRDNKLNGNCSTDLIAKKLLEGWVLHTDICDKCVMPLMHRDGEAQCVICQKEDTSGAVVALISTSGSDVMDEVDKELYQCNERRSEATNVYTSKLLAGYVMHDKPCKKCDMFMMKKKGSVECVFCPKEVKEVKKDHPKAKDLKVKKVEVNEPKAMNLSQAEIIAERIRRSKDVVNDLGKAEDDVLELIGNALDRNSDVGGSVNDYISKKKADRAAEKKKQMGNGNNKVAKAEANVVGIYKQQVEKDTASRAPLPIAIPADELTAIDTSAPVTSKFDPSISCSFENMFPPSLKKLFAGAGSENVDVICGKPQVQSPSASRIEAKQRIAKLLVDGWKVSSEGCPNCNLPLFISRSQHVHTINGMKRCVMCGPVADKSSTHYITAKISKEELTMKMVKKVMQGWSIRSNSQCPSCQMPVMVGSKSLRTHCVACDDGGAILDNENNAKQRHIDALILTNGARRLATEHPAYALQNKLQVKVSSTPLQHTVSTPNMQSKLNVKLDPPTPSILRNKNRPRTNNEPTPMNRVRFNDNDPTYEDLLKTYGAPSYAQFLTMKGKGELKTLEP